MKSVLMSIKPYYSARIFSGTKRYELRRTPVRVEPGDLVIVYASSPVSAVVGGFVVSGVARGTVSSLWRRHGRELGVSLSEYRAYFDGASVAFAIRIGGIVEAGPVTLKEIRDRHQGFRPPQSYMYWREDPRSLLGQVGMDELRRSDLLRV